MEEGEEKDLYLQDSGYQSCLGRADVMSGARLHLPRPLPGSDRFLHSSETFLDSNGTASLVHSCRGNNRVMIDVGVADEEDKPYQSFREKRRTMNKKKRVVLKHGNVHGMTNVSYKNISKKKRRYFSDLYTTLLDSSWTYCVIMFSTSFYGSWVFFGALYYMICYMHGDMAVDKATNHTPCINNAEDFASCFLFSLETQHTIGYGHRMTTTECPDAMLVMSLQSVLGCLIQAFMVGLVFSKLSRPRNRSKTIIFSHHAVINQRDRKLCLVIRIGDLRDDNFILGTQLSAKLLRNRVTMEGEILQEMVSIKITPETTNESCVFFVWPLDIVHIIDEGSPFYDLSAEELARERFELLIVMEGTNETSNMTFQSRSSYLPSEIKWGKRFEKMLLYRKDQNKFQVNFSAFHSTYEVNTPLCSGRDLDRLYREREGDKRSMVLAPRPQPTFLPVPNRKNSQFSMYHDRCQHCSSHREHPSDATISRTNSNVTKAHSPIREVVRNSPKEEVPRPAAAEAVVDRELDPDLDPEEEEDEEEDKLLMSGSTDPKIIFY